jgi:hypothetical protein
MGVRLLVLPALLLVGAAASTATAASVTTTSVRVTYVAGARWGSGAEYVTERAGVTVTGALRFRPARSTVQIRIDDKGVPDGQTVAVLGLHGSDWTCLPVRTAVTVGGFTPGGLVTASIEGDRVWSDAGCTGHAVAGTATITL